MSGTDLYHWEEHSCSQCSAIFSITSFLFHFVLSENNRKVISTGLPEKWRMLAFCCHGNTSLILNCLRILCRDYAKRNAETDTTAARGCETYTCTTQNPELGIFQTGKQMNHKACVEIVKIFLGSFLCVCLSNSSVCWQFWCTKYDYCMSKQVWTGLVFLCFLATPHPIQIPFTAHPRLHSHSPGDTGFPGKATVSSVHGHCDPQTNSL